MPAVASELVFKKVLLERFLIGQKYLKKTEVRSPKSEEFVIPFILMRFTEGCG
jgi:hypothetical protein